MAYYRFSPSVAHCVFVLFLFYTTSLLLNYSYPKTSLYFIGQLYLQIIDIFIILITIQLGMVQDSTRETLKIT